MDDWVITKFCRIMTGDTKDVCVNSHVDKSEMNYRFRLVDDDNNVYAYGRSKEQTFDPLMYYIFDYEVTAIQYRNNYGKYEFL